MRFVIFELIFSGWNGWMTGLSLLNSLMRMRCSVALLWGKSYLLVLLVVFRGKQLTVHVAITMKLSGIDTHTRWIILPIFTIRFGREGIENVGATCTYIESLDTNKNTPPRPLVNVQKNLNGFWTDYVPALSHRRRCNCDHETQQFFSKRSLLSMTTLMSSSWPTIRWADHSKMRTLTRSTAAV